MNMYFQGFLQNFQDFKHTDFYVAESNLVWIKNFVKYKCHMTHTLLLVGRSTISAFLCNKIFLIHWRKWFENIINRFESDLYGKI